MSTRPHEPLPDLADGIHVPASAEHHEAGLHVPSVLEQFIGMPLAEWAPAGTSPFPLVRVAAGHALYLEGAPARCIHLVQAGEFKTVHVAEDGYEHVLDFLGRGDVLGFDGLGDGRHAQGAFALEDAWVYGIPVADMNAMWRQRPVFASRMQAALGRQIARAGEIAWLMAAVGTDRRVARFVLHWSRRMAERGQSERCLRLRMGRRDIASHLGLAHESVSRSFSVLAEQGLICVANRQVELLDVEGLRRFALCTRGTVDGLAARLSVRQSMSVCAGRRGDPAPVPS